MKRIALFLISVVAIAALPWSGQTVVDGQQANIAVVQTRDRSTAATEAARREVDATVLKTLPETGAQIWSVAPNETAELEKMLAAGTLTHLEYGAGNFVPVIPAASVDMATLAPGQLERLKQLVGGRATGEYRVSASRPLNLSTELLHANLNSGVVQLDLVGGPTRLFRRVGEVSTPGTAGYTWQGAMMGARGEATLLVKPDGITGVVTIGAESYSITPLGGGQHVITKSAPSKEGQLPDHPPDAKRPKPSAAADTPFCQSTAANEEADILVLYTPAAKSALGTVVRDEPDWAIGTLAAALKASDTRAGVRLVDVREVSYTESASMQMDVDNIAAMPDVLKAQRDTGADLVVTYVADGRGCGWAKTIGVHQSPADGFAAIRIPTQECGRERYTFAHEVGHLYGLRHEDDSEKPYDYGHAFAIEGDARDVMGTDTICAVCQRTTLFSNPKIVRNGKPFGRADCCDNARVIRDITGKVIPRLACRK